jgi:hypothetical protein|tara:strand:- start:4442 stop:4621 length:180 start_codon:yes stop_codon:yes gene_type:complete
MIVPTNPARTRRDTLGGGRRSENEKDIQIDREFLVLAKRQFFFTDALFHNPRVNTPLSP